MTDIKKEAEEMVEKFRLSLLGQLEDALTPAKQCAIIHCELVIERLGYIFTSDEDFNAENAHYQTLIEYIKQM